MKNFRKGHQTAAEIHQWLLDMRAHSYAPASDFAVAAIFCAKLGGDEDYYFAGVNVENAEHRLAMHGEESAIASMLSALGSHAEIKEGWVIGAPKGTTIGDASGFDKTRVQCCNKCSQQIAAFADEDVVIHSVSLTGEMHEMRIGNLHPKPFTFRDSGQMSYIAQGPSLSPDFEKASKRIMRQGPLAPKEIQDWLSTLHSVNPISQVFEAVALGLDNGFYVAGTKMEEAAFARVSASMSAAGVAVSAFGNPKITEVWHYVRPQKEGLETPSLLPSDIQVLSPFAEGDTPLYFIGSADRHQTTLKKHLGNFF
jgi:cytidine deaminase